jgi:hypothetical protein
MQKTALILVLLSLFLAAEAQETIDVLALSGRYGLPKEYTDQLYSGKATETGMVNSLTAGFKVAKNTKFAINVNHFYFHVNGDPEPDFPPGTVDPVNINGILLRVGIQQNFTKGRTLLLLAGPMLMSDFRNLDGNSFQLGAMATWSRRYNENLKIGFGAMYITQFFGPYLVPILDLNWKFAPKWRLTGLIPINARVEYTVNDNMLVGLNHFGLITTYYLGDEDYAGDYLERQSIDLSLFARHRIAGPVFVEFMAGRALGRKYRQYAGDQKVDFAIPLVTFGDNRVIRNEYAAFGDGLILTLKLILNLPVPE